MCDWVLNMPLLPITETELNQSSSITESCKTPIKKTHLVNTKLMAEIDLPSLVP